MTRQTARHYLDRVENGWLIQQERLRNLHLDKPICVNTAVNSLLFIAFVVSAIRCILAIRGEKSVSSVTAAIGVSSSLMVTVLMLMVSHFNRLPSQRIAAEVRHATIESSTRIYHLGGQAD